MFVYSPPQRTHGTPLSLREWRALMAVETLRGADALLDFVPKLSPGWTRPTHLRGMAEQLAAIGQRRVRMLVSVPRRHGKTEMLLHFLAWWLRRNPALTAAYIAYSAEFAQEKSKRLRQLAAHAGLVLREDSRKASLWRTPAGGGIIAQGIGGQMTGHGVNVLIVDDPHKNREEAESGVQRRAVYNWFTSTGITSVEPGGSVIVCHTRWHQDDLIGTLRGEDERQARQGLTQDWAYLNLPAINERGEALWPERWPLEELEMRRREAGPYDWASLFMGQPRPRGGAIFHEPARYPLSVLQSNEYWNDRRILISCDPAATESTHADYSAIIVGALRMRPDRLMELDILDVRCLQVELPALVRELIGLQSRWRAPIVVESQGAFKGVAQTLRSIDRNLNVIEATANSRQLAPAVRGDKFTRAQPVAAAWNDGRVRAPIDAEWVEPLLSEVRHFTGIDDAHDDQVDALAYLWNMGQRMLQMAKVKVGSREARGLPFG